MALINCVRCNHEYDEEGWWACPSCDKLNEESGGVAIIRDGEEIGACTTIYVAFNFLEGNLYEDEVVKVVDHNFHQEKVYEGRVSDLITSLKAEFFPPYKDEDAGRMADYDVEDDLNDVHYGNRSHYCKHGVYVGSPSGADYMCGRCEDGV